MDEPYGVLRMDRAGERSVAWLRLVAAVCVLGLSVWIASTAPSARGWLAVAVGLLVSVGWTIAFVRARKRLRQDDRFRLEIEPSGFRWLDGAKDERVEWADVRSIEADEDAIVVRVEREGAVALGIEPRYERVGLHDLEALLRRAWERARAR